MQAVRDWLDDFIEGQLEISDEFKAKIQRAQQEIAGGVYSRVRKAETSGRAPRFKSARGISTLASSQLPAAIQARIESSIDRLGMTLDSHPHHRMKGVDAYRIRAGDYRVIYNFDRSKGVVHLLAVGHRREVYRK